MRLAVRVPRPAAIVAWLLVTFLVLFPKGGIKSGGTPITWGYLILALVTVPLMVIRSLVHPLRQSQMAMAAAGMIVPFQVLFLYSYMVNGAENLAYAVGVFTAFFVLPFVFLLVFPPFLPLINLRRFEKHFRFCILAAALWGIFLFFYHPLKGHYIEIPYLTVNAGDYGQIELTKHIDRGGYLKLISTYNNGNLYGVATLILLPLYLLLEKSRWRRNTVRMALVLTLSRTVWLGLMLEQGLSLLAKTPEILAQFPRVRPGKTMKQLIAIGATFGLVLIGVYFTSNGVSFLYANGLAGREGELASFSHPTLLPSVPVTTFDEVLYASALRNYGAIGFLATILIFFGPLLLIAWRPYILRIPSRRAAAKGLILYALVASIDGATILIPVLAFYWFAYMTMLFGLPGEQSTARYGLAPAESQEPSGSGAGQMALS